MSLLDVFDTDHFARVVQENEELFLWAALEGNYYVSNRHFSFRVGIREVQEHDNAGWGLLDFLQHTFKELPKDGKCLILRHGDITTSMDITKSLKNAIDLHKTPSTNQGSVTPYIYARGQQRYRWAKFKGFSLLVQDTYISLIKDAVGEPIYADGKESPTYLCDGNLIILPMKNVTRRADEPAFPDFEQVMNDFMGEERDNP